jgi:hypothetical protein
VRGVSRPAAGRVYTAPVGALLAVVGVLVVVGLVLYGFVSAPGWVAEPEGRARHRAVEDATRVAFLLFLAACVVVLLYEATGP